MAEPGDLPIIGRFFQAKREEHNRKLADALGMTGEATEIGRAIKSNPKAQLARGYVNGEGNAAVTFTGGNGDEVDISGDGAAAAAVGGLTEPRSEEE